MRKNRDSMLWFLIISCILGIVLVVVNKKHDNNLYSDEFSYKVYYDSKDVKYSDKGDKLWETVSKIVF